MSAFGNILGVRMNLMLGKGVPIPAPVDALEALEELEIKLFDTAPTGFRMVFSVGRDGPLSLIGPKFIDDERFKPDSRVVVTMIFDIKPTVIFDGVVTKRQYIPGSQSHEGKLILFGHDLTCLLSREEKRVSHMALDETAIANLIILSYAQHGIVPIVIPPAVIDPPIPIDRIPKQLCNDWAYLKLMAKRHGYHTYLDPGPAPGLSTLYWGPVPRQGVPQKALSVNIGPMSDAFDVTAIHNGEELTTVSTTVQDRNTGQDIPIETFGSTRRPQGLVPDYLTRYGQTRTTRLNTSGLNMAQAMGRAQGMVDNSNDNVVKISGKLNPVRYNGVLKPYDSCYLRGLGHVFNGEYRVSHVRHLIRPGTYEQSFEMKRGELYTAQPLVPVGGVAIA